MTGVLARDERAELLERCGARGDEIEELLAYAGDGFEAAGVDVSHRYPLADEPFVAAWEEYAQQASRDGVANTLRRHLVQLRFPVELGMSERDAYRAATRRGIVPDAPHSAPPQFENEDGLRILIHATPAGRLPVIVTSARADFELITRALAHRNEPVALLPSMGASIIGGYNDWTRVARLRERWASDRDATESETAANAAWQAELKRLMPQRELYQDRFVILSSGSYSATPAALLGLEDDAWRRMSLVIRLEHECAHYFTKRVFGSMRNSLLDELIADYTGIVAARGRFEPMWLRRFMGVEHESRWRPEGRLANYRGTPALSEGAFAVLQSMVRRAASTLDLFDACVRGGADAPPRKRSMTEVASAISAIAVTGLERMAEPCAVERLHALYETLVETSASANEPTEPAVATSPSGHPVRCAPAVPA